MNSSQGKWLSDAYAPAVRLLKTLGRIPAPSHFEEKRAEFIQAYFRSAGGEGVYIDEAKNVILPLGDTQSGMVDVFMAHTDIVFSDTQELPMREEDGKLYAPGIGDDTANLVCLMTAAKYVLEKGLTPKTGVLVVANACEEGLGNLKGVKTLLNNYKGRVRSLVSFDCALGAVVNNAVGSRRVKITVKAEGGHSYSAFGNTNAIVQMAEFIRALYEKTPPTKAKTTYNAGVIEGGSTVNSIAGECSLLYEYRSEDRDCLREMEEFFEKCVCAFREKGFCIELEELGLRPCKGEIDEAALSRLTERMAKLVTDISGESVHICAASTDANAPLSLGIPAVTVGLVKCALAHTRGEWVELESLKNGMKIALSALLHCF